MITILLLIFAYAAFGFIVALLYSAAVGLTYPFKPAPTWEVVTIGLIWPLAFAFLIEKWLRGK